MKTCVDPQQLTRNEVTRRWPRVVAHLICESLGYFSPESAAGAVLAHKQGKPFFCEWYAHIYGMSEKARPTSTPRDEKLVAIGADILKHAVIRRKHHQGCMADYNYAKALVMRARETGKPVPGTEFASWF